MTDREVKVESEREREAGWRFICCVTTHKHNHLLGTWKLDFQIIVGRILCFLSFGSLIWDVTFPSLYLVTKSLKSFKVGVSLAKASQSSVMILYRLFQYAKLVPASTPLEDLFIMDKSPLPLTAQRLAQLRPGLIIEPGLKLSPSLFF